MTMTKKDYELIARTLSDFKVAHGVSSTYPSKTDLNSNRHAWVWLYEEFAIRLEQQDSHFDRNKFLKACGVEVNHDN